MQYALLIYARQDTADGGKGPIPGALVEVLARPSVAGWARLHAQESATTLRGGEGRTLLTDGPFVESKEYLAGLVLVEAENLDGALAIAQDVAETRPGVAIEVRPVYEGQFRATGG